MKARTLISSLSILLVLSATFTVSAGVEDSLRNMYVSVVSKNSCYIVDQGALKALFNAQGKPVTDFCFSELIAGLDGRFVGTTSLGGRCFLLDKNGRTLARFPKQITSVDTIHKHYLAKEYNRADHRFNAEGKDVLENIYIDQQTYPYGFVRFDYRMNNDYYLHGIKDTLGQLIIPPVYKNVFIGKGLLGASTGDSILIFNTKGRKLFGCKGNNCMLFNNKLVGIKLYGVWAIKDSTGETIKPFKYGQLEDKSSSFIIADGVIITATGKESKWNNVNGLYNHQNGWTEVNTSGTLSGLVIDSELNEIFPGQKYANIDFIGDRYVKLYRSYGDEATAKTYDRLNNKFVDYTVEKYLGNSGYEITLPKAGHHSVIKGNEILKLPPFKTIEDNDRYDRGTRTYYIIADREEERQTSEILVGTRKTKQGVLDTNFRLIVPMKYAHIDFSSNNIIQATESSYTRYDLYTYTGQLLYSGKAHANREGKLFRITDNKTTTLIDDHGKVVYKGHGNPAPLYADITKAPEGQNPVLMLMEDSSGNQGVFNMSGKQLLPYKYHEIARRISGLISLKRGDSIYYINTKGRLIYAGKGFYGRQFYLLDGYNIVYKRNGYWGASDADGNTILPFEYDTVYQHTYSGGAYYQTLVSGTVVGKKGKYRVLTNTGRLLYPLQSWKPAEYLNPENIVKSSDNIFYDVSGHEITRIDNPNNSGSTTYPENKIMVYDSSRTKITVTDITGRTLIPFIPKPDALFYHPNSIVASYRSKDDELYILHDSSYTHHTIQLEDKRKSELVNATHRSEPYIARYERVQFSAKGLEYGFISDNTGVLWDKKIEEIRNISGFYGLKRGGKWGLSDWYMNTIIPPSCDSVWYSGKMHAYLFTKGGKIGCYYPQTRTFFEPVFDDIQDASRLEHGFCVVKKNGAYFIVDTKAQALTPALDSIMPNVYWLRDVTAYRNGEEVVLNIDDNGTVKLTSSGKKGIKMSGLDGNYTPLAILREGNKMGLYSNKKTKIILPPVYDRVQHRQDDGYFIAWKYKADKRKGIDSTKLVDPSGNILFAMKGWHVPKQAMDSLWMMGANGLPVLTPSGATIIPDDYEYLAYYEKMPFFVAKKNGKLGTLSQQGVVLTDFVLDDLDENDNIGNDYWAGSVDNDKGNRYDNRYALISPEGKLRTQPIYERIERVSGEEHGQTIFEVSVDDKYGLLDTNGREIVPCIYDDIQQVYEDIVIAAKKEQYGIVGLNGKQIAPFIYNQIGTMEDGKAAFCRGNVTGYITDKGKEMDVKKSKE